ncbi:12547_t:CDS:2 [Rhizophagus irregularis]|nr:12547_t:CDS:2 [Rhizophagus irregularis]
MFTTFSSLTPYNLGHNKLWSGTNAVVELYTKVCILAFSVNVSTQGDKLRGPSWKFSGSIDNWKIEQLY